MQKKTFYAKLYNFHYNKKGTDTILYLIEKGFGRYSQHYGHHLNLYVIAVDFKGLVKSLVS